jgi:sarcosine oxidase subunit alpha
MTTSQPNRTTLGGRLIDRTQIKNFQFDGRSIPFHPGDSIASALLASGRSVVGRSFKLHRPRGVYALGADEPNALVTTGSGPTLTPNQRATIIPVEAGMRVAGQNAWPNVQLDLFGLLDRVRPLLPAGFYYKTFMWPPSQWLRYERQIRKMAGLGPPPTEADSAKYAHRNAHADVLIAGGGPAGLSAALAAGEAGQDVILAASGQALGGGLLNQYHQAQDAWLAETITKLKALPNVRIMTMTTVVGAYEHNLFTLSERVVMRDGRMEGQPEERFWQVRSQRLIIATGGIERPLLFGDNDRPGVMLAGAASGYIWRFGVLAGRSPIIAGADDRIYKIARDFIDAGANVRAVIDLRDDPGAMADLLAADGVRVERGAMIVRAHGRHKVRAAEVWRISEAKPRLLELISADAILTTGGFGPALQLHAQARGKLSWDSGLRAFVPADNPDGNVSIGGARGSFNFELAISEGANAGRDEPLPTLCSQQAPSVHAPWDLPRLSKRPRFVDFQNDVADKDIELAAREGYRSIEHVKRYTTLGMGTDQGRAAGPMGLALLAAAIGQEITKTGVTTFRPPTTPVTFGAVAGATKGELGHAIRRTAADGWHAAQGASFIDAGLWRRPRFYKANGATVGEAYRAEAKAVREKGGMIDVSTLGKIDVQGPDAGIFLDKLYTNRISNLRLGRGRYGLMLREDGRIFDDGVVFRTGEDRFHLSCTTGGASAVYQHIEYALQVLWPSLEVYVTPVTEEWFAVAVSGPRARDLLTALLPGLDVTNSALPLMGMLETTLFDQRLLVMRISYSGELSYEINISADWGAALWRRLSELASDLEIIAYGTEAMGALRIEKGHITHAEADGRTTPDDVGLGSLVDKKKDAIGVRSLSLPVFSEAGRKQLVGLVVDDGAATLPIGAQITVDDQGATPRPSLGHVTSWAYSSELQRTIALALIKDGKRLIGERIFIVSPVMGESVAGKVVDPVFIDKEGSRLRA